MTKKQMKEEAKRILGNTIPKNNFTLGIVDNKIDHNILLSIFKNHPDYPLWDIDKFEVVRQECLYPKWNDINIIMKDGSVRKHASYNVALKPKKTDHDVEMIKSAMRQAIKDKHGSGDKDMHLDHSGYWSFEEIKRAFINEYGKEEIVKNVINLERGGQIFNSYMRKLYINFHDERAKLEFIPAFDNLSKGNKRI